MRGVEQAETIKEQIAEAVLFKNLRNLVNRFDVRRFDNAGGRDVAEQADLVAQLFLEMMFSAAEQNIRLNADLAQFHDGVLRRFGFQLAGGADIRHEGEMNIDAILPAGFKTKLANGFEKRQTLNVADGAADFGDDDVIIVAVMVRGVDDAFLDFVGDVRNDLHGFAEIIAAALFGDDGVINLAGGGVVLLRHVDVDEALVMAEIEIGFRAVFGDVHFAVLIRTHRAGIDVEVRIEFEHGDFEAARFEQHAN